MTQGPWLLGGGILLGIALGTLSLGIPFPSVVFIGIGFCLILLRSFHLLQQHFVLLAFVLFLISFWHGQQHLQFYQSLEPKYGERQVYRIVAVPEEKGFYQNIILQHTNSHWWRIGKEQILWQAPLALVVNPGEKIALECDLAVPENRSPDFDYRLYLAKEGVGYICEEPSFFELAPPDVFTRWYAFAYMPRTKLETALAKSIPEPEAGLAKGLLLGGSSHLSSVTQEQFTRLGLTHIVAVSGYNIILIVNGLLLFGLSFHLWRKSATLFAFLGTMAFIFMIGAPASAVRAGLMAVAAFGAFLIGRVSYSLVAVILTAALMTLWNPLYLWYDAGFQLSFLATLGVILSMRAVEQKLSANGWIKLIQEIVWLAVWVYLFLLPLLFLQFKTFTVLSIPANIVFLPVVPVAMLSSFVVALVALVLPASSVLIGWIAYVPLTYILRGTYFLSQLPDITVPVTLSLGVVVGWYIILLFVIVRMEEHRKQKQYEENFLCKNNTHTH